MQLREACGARGPAMLLNGARCDSALSNQFTPLFAFNRYVGLN